ncbi:hypothetical protein EV421DRAFT_1477948 [Armillaria borealis]|uniref:Uncharacterized protein n=1 Tax=Armillaria borealis TaxID=47425 RepID=A0AA39MWJ5_9AGAR|nr:hypothetical protein EV421DRAFT_1477948 [Armillaria borealis]
MDQQELIDKIIDHLQDSPYALKVCSLVSRQFYPRTRVHLFRYADCHNPESAPFFKIPRDSLEVLRCIKRVHFGCLDFFLPEHQTATVDFLHSLPSPVTLSMWDDSTWYNDHSKEECGWRYVLPAFVSSAPYLAITRLELTSPQWHTFSEFHHIVLSLPNVTELHVAGVEELSTLNKLATPTPPAPRIRKIGVDVCGDAVAFWEFLQSYRSMYLDNLEELRVNNLSPVELWTVFQTANLASNDLKVLEILFGDHQPWDFARFSPYVSSLHLNPTTDLRLGVELNGEMLPFINWWVKCFKVIDQQSTVMERLTFKLYRGEPPVTLGQLEPLKRAFEELSDLLSRLFRNVDLVLYLKDYDAHPSLCTDCLRGAIVDACTLKEKANLRAFDMSLSKYTHHVTVFPFPAGTFEISP